MMVGQRSPFDEGEKKTYFLVNFNQCVSLDKTSGYLHELRSETMYYGTKRQTIPEGRRHILDVDIVVIFTLYSAPLPESLQRSHHIGVLCAKVRLFLANAIQFMVPCVTEGRESLSHRLRFDDGARARQHPMIQAAPYIQQQPVSEPASYTLAHFRK